MTNISRNRFTVRHTSTKIGRYAIFLLALGMIAVAAAAPAMAQYVTCPDNIDLKTFKLPEIVSNDHDHVLVGTMVLADEQRAQTVQKSNVTNCLPQLRRFFQDHESAGPLNINKVERPIPGPTLRATLGDVVEITFLNQIDLLDYGNSLDRYQHATDLSAPGAGCDSVTTPGGYPQIGTDSKGKPIIDSWPNCFHGSSTANLHFHGTHTNPNSTGDNVFVEVRASPRENGMPVVTGASVKQDFDAFFDRCRALLQINSLIQWPVTWQTNPALQHWALGPDSPGFKSQKTLLQEFDATLPPINQNPDPRALWPVDDKQNAAGQQWPQYYVGAFPYCFVLPDWPGKNDGNKPIMGQAPGTHWYHAHKHGSTALNVANGMTGAFIIEGAGYDGVLNDFYNQYRTADKETPWTRQQITMVVNQLGGTPNLVSGAFSSGVAAFSINGQIVPDVSMYPGEVQMWRIVNSSAISGFYLKNFPPGFAWRQLAQDGVQFDDDNYRARTQRPVFVAPGNRVDLLVKAPASLEPATAPLMVVQGVSVSNAETTTPDVPLLNIKITGSGPIMPLLPRMPLRPEFLKDIQSSEIVNKTPRELTFETKNVAGPSEHTINGEKFGEGRPWEVKTLNTAEEWKIINKTTRPASGPIDHPFHIHINPFQITAVFDPNQPLLDANYEPVKDGKTNLLVYVFSTTQPPPGSLRPGQCWVNPNDEKTWVPCPQPNLGDQAKTNIWWDVFPIPGARVDPTTKIVVPGYFVLRSRFVDYRGAYVMHCHILAHEDRGMMMTVEVATNQAEPHHH